MADKSKGLAVALVASDKQWRPGDGLQAGMEMLDGPSELATDHIPTADQDVPVATYQDWKMEDTFVVTCRISNDYYPGTRYESRDEAVRAVTKKHGRILVANYTPGRAFFRVMKPQEKK